MPHHHHYQHRVAGTIPPTFQQGNSVCIAPGRSIACMPFVGAGTRRWSLPLSTMQFSGNLVLYRFSDGFISWASNTQNIESPDTNFFYSSDGNIGIFRQGAIVSTKYKIGDTWGSNGLFCLDVMEGVATLYNAGQASLTNPIWNSKLDGGYLVDGYPSTPTSLGPGPRIPSSTTVVQQPTSPGSTITGDSFSTAVSDIPTETAGRIPQSISIPVTASAPTTYLSLVSTVATASPTSTTNGKENPGGMNSSVIAAISSVGGGLLLIAIGLAYFYYCWRSKRDTDKGAHQAANQYFSRLTPSLVSLDKWNDRHDHHPPSSSDPADVFSITSLPVYANGSIVVVMANVPGVYVATTSHESLSDGELSYSENDQVYVLSRPGRHGWCRAKIGEAEGWIEAVNLEPLDI